MVLPKDRLRVRILPAGSPTSGPYPPRAEWENITSFVRVEDGITISGGRRNEGARVEPSTCELRLDNTDGRFSPRNPAGAYYPTLAKNTPIEIAWDVDGLGSEIALFTGFVVAWPPRWDLSNKIATAPIEAAGIIRPLSQGQKALKSALFRSLTDLSEVDPPLAYWPMEDRENATQIASGLIGGAPMTFGVRPITPAGTEPADPEDDMGFGTEAGPPGADGGIELPHNWITRGTIPDATGTAFTLEWWFDLFGGVNLQTNFFIDTPGPGEVKVWIFGSGQAGGLLQGLDSERDLVTTVLQTTPSRPPGIHHYAVVFQQVGADTTVTSYLDGVLDENWHVEPGITLNMPRRLRFTQFNNVENSQYFSHLVVWPRALTTGDLADRVLAGSGYAGEKAAARMIRLGDEEGVQITALGDPDLEMPLGPQLPTPLLELVYESEDADGGVLSESLVNQGLHYRNRHELYNQDPRLVLSVAGGHIAAPPEPTDDDEQLRNEVTAERAGGSSATFIGDQTAGRFDAEVTVNVEADRVLRDIAAWRVHLGTVDEMRWPRIALNLGQNPDLIETWLLARAVGPGFRATLDHDTTQIVGVEVDVLVEGWTETVIPDQNIWNVIMHAVPASPWKVGEFDSATYGRFDTVDAALSGPAGTTDTQIFTQTTVGPNWTTDPAEMPFDILVGGERITVTAIVDGPLTAQTLTVVRSVNGVVKAHATGTAVRLHTPARFAL